MAQAHCDQRQSNSSENVDNFVNSSESEFGTTGTISPLLRLTWDGPKPDYETAHREQPASTDQSSTVLVSDPHGESQSVLPEALPLNRDDLPGGSESKSAAYSDATIAPAADDTADAP